jgi:hypothetical protein
VPFGSSRYPSSGAVSSPVSAPLVVVPALALVDTPRTLHAHALYILAAAPEPAASAASRPLALASWRLRFARALPAAFLSPNARSERAASRAAVPETPLPGARAAARAAICRVPCHGVARLHPHSTKACECRASRKESASKRGTAAGADCLRACLARASPLPWRLSSLPPVRQVVRDQSPVQIAEEAGEQSQEQGVEHVGQRQAFCNREKGGTARVVFARRLRLLPARGRCSAMNPIMLQVGCESACTKINACCCACWRARMSA